MSGQFASVSQPQLDTNGGMQAHAPLDVSTRKRNSAPQNVGANWPLTQRVASEHPAPQAPPPQTPPTQLWPVGQIARQRENGGLSVHWQQPGLLLGPGQVPLAMQCPVTVLQQSVPGQLGRQVWSPTQQLLLGHLATHTFSGLLRSQQPLIAGLFGSGGHCPFSTHWPVTVLQQPSSASPQKVAQTPL